VLKLLTHEVMAMAVLVAAFCDVDADGCDVFADQQQIFSCCAANRKPHRTRFRLQPSAYDVQVRV
jgi:hypothetical protein